MEIGVKFLVGTSGYSFPDWVGTFYPPGTKSKDMFAFYLRRFPTVEVNYTFYRMPTAKTLEAMASQTLSEFTFWVKANQEFTHKHDLKGAKEFLEALAPMQARGQLAGLLLQYPQSLHRTVANRRALQGTLDAFASVPAAPCGSASASTRRAAARPRASAVTSPPRPAPPASRLSRSAASDT